MVIRIVYLQQNFWFYWFGLECILIVPLWFVLVSSLYAFTFVGFILVNKDAFLGYLVFFLNAIDSHRTRHFTLSLVCMHLTAASVWVVKKFFIFLIQSMFFGFLLKGIKFVSYSYYIFIAYISIGKRRLVIMCGFRCLFHHGYSESKWIQ